MRRTANNAAATSVTVKTNAAIAKGNGVFHLDVVWEASTLTVDSTP